MAGSVLDAERAIAELNALPDAPVAREEARWVVDVLLRTSTAIGETEPLIAAALARRALGFVGSHLPDHVQLEMTVRGIVGQRLASAGDIDAGIEELQLAVRLSHAHGPVEARLMDLASLARICRTAGRHRQTVGFARELLVEARTVHANRKPRSGAGWHEVRAM